MLRRLRVSKAGRSCVGAACRCAGGDHRGVAECGAWATVATTAAGAMAAHAAAEHYESLSIMYSSAANELTRLVTRRTGIGGRPLSDHELISECERVISVQTSAWTAKWGEEGSVAFY